MPTGRLALGPCWRACVRGCRSLRSLSWLCGRPLWAHLAPPPPRQPTAPTAQPAMRLVVASGQPAPTGGGFGRFDVECSPSSPRLMRGPRRILCDPGTHQRPRGHLPCDGTRILKVAALGDRPPVAACYRNSLSTPSRAERFGKVAFGAAIAGAARPKASSWHPTAASRLSRSAAPTRPASCRDLVGIRLARDQQSRTRCPSGHRAARPRDPAGALPLERRRCASSWRRRSLAGRGTFASSGCPDQQQRRCRVSRPSTRGRLGRLLPRRHRVLRLLIGTGETAPTGAMLSGFPNGIASTTTTMSCLAHSSGRASAPEGVLLRTSTASRRLPWSAMKHRVAAHSPVSVLAGSRPMTWSPSLPGGRCPRAAGPFVARRSHPHCDGRRPPA